MSGSTDLCCTSGQHDVANSMRRDGRERGVRRHDVPDLVGPDIGYQAEDATRETAMFSLKFVSFVPVSATTKPWVARDRLLDPHHGPVVRRFLKLCIGTVRIAHLDHTFFERFVDKIEPAMSASVLRYYDLDAPLCYVGRCQQAMIVHELGGEEGAETTLAALFSLLSRQGKREAGALITDQHCGCGRCGGHSEYGYSPNVFYIRDIHGVLCSVRVAWVHDGWCVYAHPVDQAANSWVPRGRVFAPYRLS